MENFNVYDMKVGDSFTFKHKDEDQLFTAEKINDQKTDVTWKKSGHNNYGRVTYNTSEVIKYVKTKCWLVIDKSYKQQNTFTKSDLISGEHIVETAESFRYLVAGNYLIGVKGYNTLTNSYKEDLKHKNYACLDIVKVFSGVDDGFICAGNGFKDYLNNVKLKLIYDRQENEHRVSQEAKLRSLEESIAEQEKEAEKLREELKL